MCKTDAGLHLGQSLHIQLERQRLADDANLLAGLPLRPRAAPIPRFVSDELDRSGDAAVQFTGQQGPAPSPLRRRQAIFS